MDLPDLEFICLTRNDVKVYLSLLKFDSVTATVISKDASMHRSKVYDSINRLIAKGLVSYTIKDFKRYFHANPPENLVKVAEEKKKILEENTLLLKQRAAELSKIAKISAPTQITNSYEGLRGIKVFHNKMLNQAKKGDEICVFGIPVIANKLLEGYFLDFHTQRISKGIKIRLLYNHESRQHAASRNKMRLTQSRCLSKEVKTPAVIWLCTDTVAIFNFKNNIVCQEIMSKDIYDTFHSYFEYMWNQSG